MRMRPGPGPVFVYEWLTASRRWQTYAMRVMFVGVILVGLALVWNQMNAFRRNREVVSIAEMASYGQAIYSTIATIELTLILLAAPAATAGAICLDKARGTLDHMLATDLSNAEIVLGKLGVRLIPVLGLVASVLPAVALSGLMGGIDPLALGGSFLATIGCALVGCALALALSVWARKAHDVIMLTYMVVLLWMMFPFLVMIGVSVFFPPFFSMAGPNLGRLVMKTNPYYLIYAPHLQPGEVDLTTFLAFLGACVAVAGGLATLATVRVRRVALRQAGRPAAAPPRLVARLLRHRLPRVPGPPLDVNPVAWREWHRTRPSWMMRIAWGLYAALGVLWVAMILRWQDVSLDAISFFNSFQVAVGLLLLSVGAATSLAEERVRGSLDVLLSTPMSTRSILLGKFWGTFGQVKPVVFWPALLSLWLLHAGGSLGQYVVMIGVIVAHGTAITSLGLAMATWVSRPGRAVALCVAAYVVFSIGWPILIAVTSPDDPVGPCLLFGCPAIGAYAATDLIGTAQHTIWREHSGTYASAVAGWIVVDLAVATVLFAATVLSFDRRLGRMPEFSTPSRRPPDGRSSLSVFNQSEFGHDDPE